LFVLIFIEKFNLCSNLVFRVQHRVVNIWCENKIGC